MAITDDLCRSWLDLLWHFDPAAGAAAGRAGASVRLGRFDPDSVREHLAACRAMAGALEELALEEVNDEIDRTALLAALRGRVARWERDEPHRRDPGFWLEHLGRALLPLARPTRSPAAQADALLALLRAVPDYLRQARQTIRRPPTFLAATAAEMAPQLVEEIHDLVRQYDPFLADQPGELAAAATDAEAALVRLRLALANELSPDESAHAAGVGEERFGWILHHDFMLRASAGEVWRWGHTLADEAEVDVASAAAELAPGADWRDTFERLREEALVTGDLLEATAEALVRARAMTLSHHLLGERAGEIDVRQAPRWLAGMAPFTAYDPPAPAGTGADGVLYLMAPVGPVEPEAVAWQRGELDRHRLAALAAHDGWPGRHAQAVAARGAGSEVRRWTVSPVAVAGWGCYAEELMVESGHLDAPEDQLAQRVLRLIRAMRVVVDAGIHTGQLTPAAAEELLLQRVPMDRHAALAEVHRVCAAPGAASAYALGRREYLQMRGAWVAAHGSGAPLRAYHEEVLSYGRIPPALVSWGMGLD